MGSGGRLEFNTGTTGGERILTSQARVNDSTWKHIVVIRDTTSPDRIKKIYINSMLENFASFDAGAFLNNATNISVGRVSCEPPGLFHYYDGVIDDIRIFNRPLSETEIQALFHEGAWQ